MGCGSSVQTGTPEGKTLSDKISLAFKLRCRQGHDLIDCSAEKRKGQICCECGIVVDKTFGRKLSCPHCVSYLLCGGCAVERSPLFLGQKCPQQHALALTDEERVKSGNCTKCRASLKESDPFVLTCYSCNYDICKPCIEGKTPPQQPQIASQITQKPAEVKKSNTKKEEPKIGFPKIEERVIDEQEMQEMMEKYERPQLKSKMTIIDPSIIPRKDMPAKIDTGLLLTSLSPKSTSSVKTSTSTRAIDKKTTMTKK